MKTTSTFFEELYQKHHRLVFNLAVNYVNNIEDAEEITQDVFIKIYHSLDYFQQKSTPKTWIYRITINRCLDFLKAKKRRKRWAQLTYLFNQAGELQHETPDFQHPGIALEQQENAKILFAIIQQLPEQQQTVFMLSHIQELSNWEISEIINKSLSATQSLLHRARENVKERLRKYK